MAVEQKAFPEPKRSSTVGFGIIQYNASEETQVLLHESMQVKQLRRQAELRKLGRDQKSLCHRSSDRSSWLAC